MTDLDKTIANWREAKEQGREFFIIKRGLFYRPDNCGYTDRPILAGLYTEADAIATSYPTGSDGPRDGMFCKHHSEVGDADWVAFKALADAYEAQAKRIAELEAALEPFSNITGEMFARNWNQSDPVIALDSPGGAHRLLFGDFLAARAAL